MTYAQSQCWSVRSAACRQALEERQDVLTHEIQSLDEDRRLLKQYRDSDTVVDPRAGAGAQVERARSITTPPSLPDGPSHALSIRQHKQSMS